MKTDNIKLRQRQTE